MFVEMKKYRAISGEEKMIDKLYAQPNYYNSDSGIDINCKSSSTFSEIEKNIELLDIMDENSNQKELWEICYSQNDDGNTQLHLSILNEQIQPSVDLIAIATHPCLLDICNDYLQTALHFAVAMEQPQILRLLMLNGADPNIRDSEGNTPLHQICISENINCAKAMLLPLSSDERTYCENNGYPMVNINFEQINYKGQMTIHLAASKGNLELVKLLHQAGVNLHSKDGLRGYTALHLAIENRNIEMILYLLWNCRSLINVVTNGKLTVYQLAYDVDQRIAKLLLTFGADDALRSDSEDDSDLDQSFDSNTE